MTTPNKKWTQECWASEAKRDEQRNPLLQQPGCVGMTAHVSIPIAREIDPVWLSIHDAGRSLLGGEPNERFPRTVTSLVLECTIPKPQTRKPIRIWQGRSNAETALAIYRMPGGSLRLIHGEIDIATGPDLARRGETLSLIYRTCARGRQDLLSVHNLDRGVSASVRPGVPRATRLVEIVPRDVRFFRTCHVAAIAQTAISMSDAPGFAEGTRVQTRFGPLPIECLRAGSDVITTDGRRKTVQWIERRPRVCLGRMAPIRLRAPYFGLAQDVVVTPGTCVQRGGTAVEYMFAQEKVLVRAEDMLRTAGAERDRSKPVRDFYHLMLDDHACLQVDGCGIETADFRDIAQHSMPEGVLSDGKCLPVLDRASAMALATETRRGRATG